MREHGTYVKYVQDRCRCEPCRKANSAYEKRRRRRKAYGGDHWPWVDARKARAHVLSLMPKGGRGRRAGVGLKRIAEVSGVSHGALSKLVYGDRARGMPPSKKIRRGTEQRILAVDPEDAPDGGLVPAGPAWRQIDELGAFGIPKARIARELGRKAPALQLGKTRVEARNAKAVADLHWRLWAEAPNFRLACSCPPPLGSLEVLAGQVDAKPPESPNARWAYPTEKAAKSVASRAAGEGAPCVVALDPEGPDEREEEACYRWFLGPEYVPEGLIVVARKENGAWVASDPNSRASARRHTRRQYAP